MTKAKIAGVIGIILSFFGLIVLGIAGILAAIGSAIHATELMYPSIGIAFASLGVFGVGLSLMGHPPGSGPKCMKEGHDENRGRAVRLPHIENGDVIAPLLVGSIRLRASRYGILLECMVNRRWWQLWRPRQYLRILDSEPFQFQAGDLIQLTQKGQCYTVTVNDSIVLQYGEPDD